MSVNNTTYSSNGNGQVHIELPVKTKLPEALVEEITKALHSVGGYGSIEIYITDHSVTQITVRNIRKTKHYLAE